MIYNIFQKAVQGFSAVFFSNIQINCRSQIAMECSILLFISNTCVHGWVNTPTVGKLVVVIKCRNMRSCFQVLPTCRALISDVTKHVIHDHYGDVIMGAIASQITSLTIVYSTVYSDADQRKYEISASLAFVWGIHRWPVNSPHKWPVTRKMLPFDDVII